MEAAVVPAVSSSRQVKDVGNLSSDQIKCYTPILLGNAYRSTPISLPGDGHRAPQQNTNDPRAAWAVTTILLLWSNSPCWRGLNFF
jgi:hypothetical protein